MDLIKMRKKYGFTQQEISEIVDLTRGNYNMFEKGKYKLMPSKRKKLEDFYSNYLEIYTIKENFIKKYKNNFKV